MRKSEWAAILLTLAAVCVAVGFLLARRVPQDSYVITTDLTEQGWFSEEQTAPVFAPGDNALPEGPDPADAVSTGGAPSPTPTPRGLIDLNTASAAELQDLPGIGPVLAERIIAYREEHGGFAGVEALTEVAGIGEKIFAELKDLVTARQKDSTE